MEEIEDQTVEAVGQLGVVARAFVTHEGVGSVDLVPAQADAEFVEPGKDLQAAFERDVRVLRPQIMRSSPWISAARSRESSFMPLPRPPLWMSVA